LKKRFGYFIGQPVTIMGGRDLFFRPRWLLEDADHSLLTSTNRVEFFDTLLEFCLAKKPDTVCLYRTYALGDILMLLPLARRLRQLAQLTEPITIIVEDRFIDSIGRGLREWHEIQFLPEATDAEKADYGCDVHIDLNGALETDHRGGEDSYIHRLNLYGRVLGLDVRVPP